jgi:hypothetical protein
MTTYRNFLGRGAAFNKAELDCLLQQRILLGKLLSCGSSRASNLRKGADRHIVISASERSKKKKKFLDTNRSRETLPESTYPLPPPRLT